MNTSQLMRSSAVMAAGTFTSRILGFVRAALLLAALATGTSADAFNVANTIPNALYILLAGGVLNAVLVPQITRAAKNLDGGQEYIDRLLTMAVTVLFVVTVVTTAAAPFLIRIYASNDWEPRTFALATAFALWCLPQIFFYGLYTLLGQVLNARGSFGPFMWAPVVNNIVGIAGIMWLIHVAGTPDVHGHPVQSWQTSWTVILAGSASLGVIAQALILIPALRRAGISYRPRWGLRGFGLRTAGRVAGWTFAAVVAQQLGYIVVTQVATTAEGLARTAHSGFASGYTVYTNSFLLFMLPHSLIAVSLVTALFTRMSISASNDRLDEVRADLSLGLRVTGLATVVSAAAFLAVGVDLVRTIFPKGGMFQARGIAYVTGAMMIGLIAFSAQYLFQRVFYAFEDAKTPFFIQVVVVLTWAGGNLLSLHLLSPAWIVVGIGAAMTVSNLVGAALSIALLRGRLGRLDGRRITRAYVKFLAAAAAGGLVAAGLSYVLHAGLGDAWLTSVLAAVLGGGALLTVYYVVLRRLGTPELDELLRPLLRRRAGRHAEVS
ncbi:murein biosynthesis integral membrane protein MurJ [Spongisporangium articulatum]|uniref:Murein biosynthesis integral membrane protein MurJ n=1 Tax=Spongisporangium articulatum TaxID=3362603 RepID=A0ABW8AI01_9ACTN